MLPPNELVMQPSFKDVWLSYFKDRQHSMDSLVSGDVLEVNGNEGLNWKGKTILKFSKRFIQQIEKLAEKKYQLKSAKVNYILYWKGEEEEKEWKILLPELYFEKADETSMFQE